MISVILFGMVERTKPHETMFLVLLVHFITINLTTRIIELLAFDSLPLLLKQLDLQWLNHFPHFNLFLIFCVWNRKLGIHLLA